MKRKIIQISTMATSGGTDEVSRYILVSLCDDGTVWWKDPLEDKYRWEEITLDGLSTQEQEFPDD